VAAGEQARQYLAQHLALSEDDAFDFVLQPPGRAGGLLEGGLAQTAGRELSPISRAVSLLRSVQSP